MATLGSTFVDRDGNIHSSSSLDGKVLGLYFSASWCPPCRQFTPHLIDWYTSGAVTKDEFQIIFVSSDRTKRQFDDYLGEMEWLAIPFEDAARRQKLKKHYDVKSVPKLVVLDPNGDVISPEGRKLVLRYPNAFPWLDVDPNVPPKITPLGARAPPETDDDDDAVADWKSTLMCYGLGGVFAALATSYFYLLSLQ
eukprot:m.19023 g.19023  ORF g.19023 m.19023 type:complete len:195 (-) comp10883_c0_seq1:106-690(-)